MAIKILIVDDSLTVRIVLKRLLGVMDLPPMDVLEADNGYTGLAVMRAQHPDLVMADLNMEGMSGLEMIQQMRADPALAAVAVVVISSEGNPEVTQALAEAGVREFIRKPFDLGSLSQLIPRVLASAVAG